MELADSTARTRRFRSLRHPTTVFSLFFCHFQCASPSEVALSQRSAVPLRTIRRLHASCGHSCSFHRRFPRFYFYNGSALPSSDLVALCQTYCSVLSQGEVSATLERDSHSGLPLWMLLFALLRSGCTRGIIERYQDDILRHGGAVGHDIYRLLLAFVEYFASIRVVFLANFITNRAKLRFPIFLQ